MKFNITDYMVKYNENLEINNVYKINKTSNCKLCNIEITKDYYCKKCNYNLNLCIKAMDYFFFTIKRLNKYNSNLIIDIFNNFNKFINLLKLSSYEDTLIYSNIINKIKKLTNTEKKNTSYISSNTRTFIYYIFK